jgi:hypothetical protein
MPKSFLDSALYRKTTGRQPMPNRTITFAVHRDEAYAQATFDR